jgi:hypothetical protein
VSPDRQGEFFTDEWTAHKYFLRDDCRSIILPQLKDAYAVLLTLPTPLFSVWKKGRLSRPKDDVLSLRARGSRRDQRDLAKSNNASQVTSARRYFGVARKARRLRSRT